MKRARKSLFGEIKNRPVLGVTLTNNQDMQAVFTEYGAMVHSLLVPDKNGQLADVLLGHDTLQQYADSPFAMAATIGRTAGRTFKGECQINELPCQLVVNNDDGHHQHGGRLGFHRQIWRGRLMGNNRVQFTYLSPDGDQGYPGEMCVTVTYTLGEDNSLTMHYNARSSEDTLANITNHAYFNLGAGVTVLDHLIQINAPRCIPVKDTEKIPTGAIVTLDGRHTDLRAPKIIGEVLNRRDRQLEISEGLDLYYLLDSGGDLTQVAASVHCPTTGRRLQIHTTQPGINCFTAQNLGGVVGKNGVVYERRAGVCLMPQKPANAVNRPNFPSTLLQRGDLYDETTIWKFDVV